MNCLKMGWSLRPKCCYIENTKISRKYQNKETELYFLQLIDIVESSFTSWARLTVKLICGIAIGAGPSACLLLKSLANIL